MTAYIIRNGGRIDYVIYGQDPAQEAGFGQALASFNLDHEDPFAVAQWTDDESKALRFESVAHAWETWQMVAMDHPTRKDGEPNRPLTLWTVSIEEVPGDVDE